MRPFDGEPDLGPWEAGPVAAVAEEVAQLAGVCRIAGRDGSVVVAPGRALVIVEGVGSSRTGLRPRLDAAVWVQSDAAEARRRRLEGDVRQGREREAVEAFWDEWMHEDRPWESADLVVCRPPHQADVLPSAGTMLVATTQTG